MQHLVTCSGHFLLSGLASLGKAQARWRDEKGVCLSSGGTLTLHGRNDDETKKTSDLQGFQQFFPTSPYSSRHSASKPTLDFHSFSEGFSEQEVKKPHAFQSETSQSLRGTRDTLGVGSGEACFNPKTS